MSFSAQAFDFTTVDVAGIRTLCNTLEKVDQDQRRCKERTKALQLEITEKGLPKEYAKEVIKLYLAGEKGVEHYRSVLTFYEQVFN